MTAAQSRVLRSKLDWFHARQEESEKLLGTDFTLPIDQRLTEDFDALGTSTHTANVVRRFDWQSLTTATSEHPD